MAKPIGKLYGFCSVFLVLLFLEAVLSVTEDYYYSVDNPDNNIFSGKKTYISLVLDNEHHIHKRQVTPPPPIPPQRAKDDVKPLDKDLSKVSTYPTHVPNITEIPEKLNSSSATNFTISTTKATVDLNSTKDVDEEDISINKFSNSDLLNSFNSTLRQNNITITQLDNHIYYNSSFKTDIKTGQYFWVNMTNNTDAKISDLLSKSHRRAATVRLSFDFPFYGHIIRNVTIATGGFLYTGDYVHSWLAATQYIAPLMANFDTSLSDDSYIKYKDNGTSFTVLWENVSLQDKPKEGSFTFEATLHDNGDIVFVYQSVPVIIENIEDSHHPVKVGLSDAYIIDRTVFFIRRKTIYEYHRVNFRKEDIKNGTIIYLTALPTCPVNTNCQDCLTKAIHNFNCFWCPGLNKCSNGLDRSRQEWLQKSCDKKQYKNASECSQPYISSDTYDEHDAYNHENNYDQSIEDVMRSPSHFSQDSSEIQSAEPVRMGLSGIVAMLSILSLTIGLAVWIFYAYRNPHTTSGQILIRYRPSQWSWRRGEARYTAATIHM